MVHDKSANLEVGKLAKRLEQNGSNKMVKNKVERKSGIIRTLEIGTSMIFHIFVIEYEEPYKARVLSTVP